MSIINTLAAKGVNRPCEACGKGPFNAVGNVPTVDLPITQTGGNIRMPPPSVPAHFFYCANCGNVRLHIDLSQMGAAPGGGAAGEA